MKIEIPEITELKHMFKTNQNMSHKNYLGVADEIFPQFLDLDEDTKKRWALVIFLDLSISASEALLRFQHTRHYFYVTKQISISSAKIEEMLSEADKSILQANRSRKALLKKFDEWCYKFSIPCESDLSLISCTPALSLPSAFDMAQCVTNRTQYSVWTSSNHFELINE